MSKQIFFTRQLEMGKSAFVQHTMAATMAALVTNALAMGELFTDPEDFDPEPTTSERHMMQRFASISVTAAETLAKAYGPIGFTEPRDYEVL